MDMREFFAKFIEEKFEDDHAYDTAYFKRVYNIDPRISRHHLELGVDRGKLFCLKVHSGTFYLKPQWKDAFKQLADKVSWISVR